MKPPGMRAASWNAANAALSATQTSASPNPPMTRAAGGCEVPCLRCPDVGTSRAVAAAEPTHHLIFRSRHWSRLSYHFADFDFRPRGRPIPERGRQ
jgi:hypothetical protein